LPAAVTGYENVVWYSEADQRSFILTKSVRHCPRPRTFYKNNYKGHLKKKRIFSLWEIKEVGCPMKINLNKGIIILDIIRITLINRSDKSVFWLKVKNPVHV
jgi:hypothetical protein